MKKFTFIAMLMLILCGVAKADDKYFFKVPTDKMASGWVIQDAGNFVSTPGKEYLEVKNNKNGGRMLNYFWNEDAWSKTDISTLPNSTYKFTMDLNMSNMANRADMEFTLLPVNACTSTDARISTHNQRWWNSADGEDYFFRWRVGAAPAANNQDFTLYINENPTGKTDWTKTTEDSLVVKSQTTYKFAVVINAAEKTATYTISSAEGEVLKTGVHAYKCDENRAGIFIFSMNGSSTHQLSNIGLSYEANGPFANEPTSELLGARKEKRDYYVTFNEGEVLHWIQLGDAESAQGESYEDGQEYTAYYYESNDTRGYEQNTEEYFGSKIIYCTKSGDLKMWTSREEDESNVSDNVIVPVTCEALTMPTPVATITNVKEGYAKEYTLTVDNSTTLLTPTVTIHYVIKDAAGNVKEEKDAQSGEVVSMADAGSLEIYGYDGTHSDPWYLQSETVDQKNDVEYVKASFTDYAWSKADCDGTKAGFTKKEIIDNANKSHWDRIYSDQKYGYDENGNASAWADGTEYASVKQGFGFYEGTSIGSDNAKWNVQVPEDATTALAPLAPTADVLANAKYVASALNIFPLEGIVYYDLGLGNYVDFALDSKYTSDDASKPNFYIVHTRGGYDRPDKGDCNKTTVCVAGENYSLFRYDTALCDVTVMTYKGFVPGTTGISSVNAAETVAPTVKKIATKNGIVIVKGNKAYSVTGAQIK